MNDKWKHLEKYLRYNPNYMLFYRWFLKDFLNQDVTINEDYINAMAIDSDNISVAGDELEEYENLDRKSFFSDTFICHIRMDLKNPGEVLAVSKSCYGFTGYTAEELMHQKVNKLMPKMIADIHDSVLKQYISVGMKFTDERIQSFMKLKDNSVKPINLTIKMFYQVYGNIEMVGLFREIRSRVENPEYIVMNNSGVAYHINQYIQGMTRNLCDELGLPPDIFSLFDYNVMINLPEFKDFYCKSVMAKENKESHPLEKKNSQGSGNRFLNDVREKLIKRQVSVRSDRSQGSLDINTGAREHILLAELNLEIVGFDIETKQFGLIFKMPFNIIKYVNDFKGVIEVQKQHEKSIALSNSQVSIPKPRSSMISISDTNKPATPLLRNLFSGFKDTVNRKDTEIVAYGLQGDFDGAGHHKH